MFIAHTELLLQIIDGKWVFLNAEKHFYKVKNALSERGYRIYIYFFVITLQLYSIFKRKLYV